MFAVPALDQLRHVRFGLNCPIPQHMGIHERCVSCCHQILPALLPNIHNIRYDKETEMMNKAKEGVPHYANTW